MTKFKELIDKKSSALIFVEKISDEIPKKIIDFLEEKEFSISKIDLERNSKLCEALRIEKVPYFMIYKNGQRLIETQCNFNAFIDGVKTVL